MKLSSFEIRRRILRKMVRHSWWGGKHAAFDNIPKGFPKELWKDVKKELEQLAREGIVIKKPTGYGLHVSLNVRMKAEIERMVFK
jgi:ATP-dependent DNA ligase